MRRDMDLLRAILLAVEGNDDPFELIDPGVEGHAELAVCRHIALAAEAGLITARDRSAIGVYYWSAGQLTWAGHEFLDLVRDETLWTEAKRLVEHATGSLAFELLRAEAVALARRRMQSSGPG